MTKTTDWQGRFPRNEIISLLDVNRRFNLGESTAQDLTCGELFALAGGAKALEGLKLGYGTSSGLPRLRAVIAAQAGVSPDAVVTMQGTALGLFLLAHELCGPGDEVVIATPCFPPARDTLAATGATLRACALHFDQGFRLTADLLEPLMNDRTRLISIASPQNPSGVRTSHDTIEEILAVMRRKAPQARLFIDETYRDASYGEEPTPPSAAALDPAIITGGSVSKAHGAPGLRVGWLVVSDPALRERLTIAKMNTVLSGSPLDETLAAAILENRDTILGPRRALLAEGVATVAQWVADQDGLVEWVRPHSGALCCMRLSPRAFDAAAVARFWAALPDAELQLADGGWFGADRSMFRLGFGYLPMATLPAALAELSRVVARTASV
ncbi:MAG: hypothetical protein RLZZ528_1179 [Pseudomonadota bacterium]